MRTLPSHADPTADRRSGTDRRHADRAVERPAGRRATDADTPDTRFAALTAGWVAADNAPKGRETGGTMGFRS